MKTEQGRSSWPSFLSVSQEFEVMTEWQVYLGFPRLGITQMAVGGRLVLAPALSLSGAQVVLGEKEKQLGQVDPCKVTVLSVGTSSALPGPCLV